MPRPGDPDALPSTTRLTIASRRAPGVDVLHEPLDGVEIAGKIWLASAEEISRDVRQLHHVGDRPGGEPERALDVTAGRGGDRSWRRPAAAPGWSAAPRSGAADRTISTASASARPRVSMKPSRRCSRWLRAWTSQARRMSAGSTRRPSNGLLPGDHLVVGEDRAEFERERVERALELVGREQERRRQPGPVPARRAGGAGRRSSPVSAHDRQRLRQRASMSGCGRRAPDVRAADRTRPAIAGGCRRSRAGHAPVEPDAIAEIAHDIHSYELQLSVRLAAESDAEPAGLAGQVAS